MKNIDQENLHYHSQLLMHVVGKYLQTSASIENTTDSLGIDIHQPSTLSDLSATNLSRLEDEEALQCKASQQLSRIFSLSDSLCQITSGLHAAHSTRQVNIQNWFEAPLE